MKKSDVNWFDALEAMYGTCLADRQIEVWQVYLREQSASNDELVAAIEAAAADGLKPVEWRVTVRDVRLWLSRHRARREEEGRRARAEAKLMHLVEHWREKVRRGVKQDDVLAAIDKEGLGVRAYNRVVELVFDQK